MMPKELLDDDMSEAIDGMRTRQEAFALATIIRTAGATAAKPGAKAVLDAQGQIVFGWIGGAAPAAPSNKASCAPFTKTLRSWFRSPPKTCCQKRD